MYHSGAVIDSPLSVDAVTYGRSPRLAPISPTPGPRTSSGQTGLTLIHLIIP